MSAPPSSPPSSALQDLKLAAAWGALAALSVAAVVPYLMQLMPERFARLPLPLGVVVAMQAAQALVLLGLLSWLGLRMGHRVGLGSPVLRAWLVLRTLPDWARLRPLQTMLLGMAAGAAILGLSALVDGFLPPAVHPPAQATAGASALNGLLASFYGGIAEELQLRLFLMTLLVWVVARRRGAPPPSAYWVAIAVAALLFGAGHLPAAAHVWGLDAAVVARTLLLNGVGGMVFGWLYWKRGIEMAMLAHFAADLVLHVLAPVLLPGTAP
ncbi:CPBP family intramembrane metalloprotease [Pseudoxanthomonas broegbernensis]|uniref:CPBP family intramembrane metalloprotease n=1 Tax=Pseudoxanthomonas broegbernensis TaxID=83619 RepID=A0A7V8GM55_9GAMM|nr:CPBP family intramembrane glutamic endopeptidase [Pseudoxanthomonas broegbernensis]KAF1686276.1 CPBP family intramembrane metalloprotease [Pseudoxanthomonas broegbernensis]MBB6063958.1 membrane protease YdiL (CAAX protease family) [Pseudoxanthomonas broegbernensis]